MPYRNYEDRLKRSKEYYHKNREEVRAKQNERNQDPEVKAKKAKSDAKYRDQNKEQISATKKEYYQKNKEAILRSRKLKKYNLTEEQLTELESVTHCQICGVVLDCSRKTHIDHCHSTGKVRGVICADCNHGLGNFKDNPKFLANAISYLHASKEETSSKESNAQEEGTED